MEKIELQELTAKVIDIVKDLSQDDIGIVGLGLIAYSEDLAKMNEELKLKQCAEMYEERNKLGKRMYSKAECAEYFGVPKKRFYSMTSNKTNNNKDNK